ncbi:plasmid stability protein [Serratia marcescens]|uniref:plasmid partitioning/stability family protein n=1 Tax=Enterobacterales TaxID=91347 RepID=UPI00062C5700|nr:plasmid partitioning/stability family protein [Serratia marcescens]KKZ15806.1 plasmid stability protein [Serratia marcescens]
MSEDRKKFTLYLHPEHDADRQALNVIESVSRSARGELFRHAFIAGMALHQLDSRLPALLSTLFSAGLTADQLVALVGQTTGWKPSQADIRSVLAELGAGQNLPPADEPAPGAQDELAVVRSKLKGFL